MPSLRRRSISSDSSDEENDVSIITNGLKAMNGVVNSVNGNGVQDEVVEEVEESEPEEECEPGMKNGLHNMYSGKEGMFGAGCLW